MTKKNLKTINYIVIAVIAAVMIPAAKADSCCPGEGHSAIAGHKEAKNAKPQECPMSAKNDMVANLHSNHFPMVMKSIDKALKALESGDKKTATVELRKAKMMMAIMDNVIAKHAKPKFVNVNCPIMGSPINPDKVAKNLVREYKGQKIAFCCAGCPESWDKLSESKKEAKLAKVKPAEETMWTCTMHPAVKASKPGLCPKCNMKLIKAEK